MAAWMRSSSSTVRMRTAIEASCLPEATDASDTRPICRDLEIPCLGDRPLGSIGASARLWLRGDRGQAVTSRPGADFLLGGLLLGGALPAAADDGEVAAVELEGVLLLEDGEEGGELGDRELLDPLTLLAEQ